MADYYEEEETSDDPCNNDSGGVDDDVKLGASGSKITNEKKRKRDADAEASTSAVANADTTQNDHDIMWSLRFSRCVQLPPPQFCSAVNPNKTNHGCVGFCSIVCLLMAIKFLNDGKLCASKWLRAKKNTKEIAKLVKTLLRTARLDGYD
ncbi:uncharacterized protein [Montipora foliosa]|uniref:uncharacterized protein n=1 Tax=Montipora foliosa TaxID=591990 RepID=UPI0035F1943A